MSDAAVGILVFVGISLICALLSHIFIRKYLIATVVAAPAASLAFQIVATVQLGYMDPFALIAFRRWHVLRIGVCTRGWSAVSVLQNGQNA